MCVLFGRRTQPRPWTAEFNKCISTQMGCISLAPDTGLGINVVIVCTATDHLWHRQRSPQCFTLCSTQGLNSSVRGEGLLCHTSSTFLIFIWQAVCVGGSNQESQLTVLTSLVPMIPPISPRSLSSKFKISVALFFWWLLSSCSWPSSLWVVVRTVWKDVKAKVTLPSSDPL